MRSSTAIRRLRKFKIVVSSGIGPRPSSRLQKRAHRMDIVQRMNLTKAVFEAVAEHLEARGALLRGGTIVDATLIAASPSTKRREA